MRQFETCTYASMCSLCTMLESELGITIGNGGALIMLTLQAAGCLTSWLLTLVKIAS